MYYNIQLGYIFITSEEEENRNIRQRLLALEEVIAGDGNGSMMWRIDNVSQHRRSAINGSEKYQSKIFCVTRSVATYSVKSQNDYFIH